MAFGLLFWGGGGYGYSFWCQRQKDPGHLKPWDCSPSLQRHTYVDQLDCGIAFQWPGARRPAPEGCSGQSRGRRVQQGTASGRPWGGGEGVPCPPASPPHQRRGSSRNKTQLIKGAPNRRPMGPHKPVFGLLTAGPEGRGGGDSAMAPVHSRRPRGPSLMIPNAVHLVLNAPPQSPPPPQRRPHPLGQPSPPPAPSLCDPLGPAGHVRPGGGAPPPPPPPHPPLWDADRCCSSRPAGVVYCVPTCRQTYECRIAHAHLQPPKSGAQCYPRHGRHCAHPQHTQTPGGSAWGGSAVARAGGHGGVNMDAAQPRPVVHTQYAVSRHRLVAYIGAQGIGTQPACAVLHPLAAQEIEVSKTSFLDIVTT